MADEFKKLVTDIPEEVAKNTVIETDLNSGQSLVEFRNYDLSLTDDQKGQYDYAYATVDCDRDEYYDKEADAFDAMFLVGYNTPEEAKAGHDNIVRYIMAHGTAEPNEDMWIKIARGQ